MVEFLFPRISTALGRSVHVNLAEMADCAELQQYSATTHDLATFGQTGGRPVSTEEIGALKERIEQLAVARGYPDNRNRTDLREFDDECALILATDGGPDGGEALRPDIWCFFGTVLLPHIVLWRFPNFNAERLLGGVRNAFQRLWLRAVVFDRGEGAENRWAVMNALTEDAYSAILERPGLSANRRVGLAIGEAWLRASAEYGTSRMEDINRRATKTLRARIPVIHMDSLSDADLKDFIDTAYTAAATGDSVVANG